MSVLAATLVSVFVPVVYVALIALASWGVWLYAVHLTWLVTTANFGIFGLTLYLGPVIGGVLIVLFMLQPLAAWRRQADTRLVLTREREPRLIAFIEDLCDLAGAPRPVRITATLDTNADAGLDRFFTGRGAFVVSFGMPLAGTFDVPSFAAVLVHELAHCRQRVAMRAWWAMTRVNQRLDAAFRVPLRWQRAVAVGAENPFGAILFVPAVVLVFTTRQLLTLLAKTGMIVRASLSRRMEAEADHLSALVAGSGAAAAALRQCDALALAAQSTREAIDNPIHGRCLPDDLVACIMATFRRLRPADGERPSTEFLSKPRSIYALHPRLDERLHDIRALNAPGVVDQHGTATDLFDDFTGISLDLTRAAYERVRRPSLESGRVIPASEFLARVDSSAESRDIVDGFFGVGSTLFIEPISLADPTHGAIGLPVALERMAAHRPEVPALLRTYDGARVKQALLLAARLARLQGVSVNASNIGLEPAAIDDAGSLDAAIDRALMRGGEEIARIANGFTPFRIATTDAITIAIREHGPAHDDPAAAPPTERDLLILLVNATISDRAGLSDATLCLQARLLALGLLRNATRPEAVRLVQRLTSDARAHLRPALTAVLAIDHSPDLTEDDTVRRAWHGLVDCRASTVPPERILDMLVALYQAALARLLILVTLAAPRAEPQAATGLIPDAVTALFGRDPTDESVRLLRQWSESSNSTIAAVLRKRTPRLVAVPALVVAYLIAFAVMRRPSSDVSTPVDVLVSAGAVLWPLVAGGDWWRLFTACFVSEDVVALALALVSLLAIGIEAERVLGTVVFVGCYLLAGVVTGLAVVQFKLGGVFIATAHALFGVAVLMQLIHSGLFTTGGIGHAAGREPVLAFSVESSLRVIVIEAVLVVLALLQGVNPICLTVPIGIAFVVAKFVAYDADVRQPPPSAIAAIAIVTLVVTAAMLANLQRTHDMRTEASQFLVTEQRALRTFSHAASDASGGPRAVGDAVGRVVDERLRSIADTRVAARQIYARYQRELAAAGRHDRYGRISHLDDWFVASDQIEVGNAYLVYLDSRDAAWLMRLDAVRQSKADALKRLDRADAEARQSLWAAVRHTSVR